MLAADEDARVISGGQTLIPMLAMRIARPTRLIDIYRLPESSGIGVDDDMLAIGATTVKFWSSAVQRCATFVRCWRKRCRGSVILRRAIGVPWVDPWPTPNPSAEIPLVAVTLGAEIEITIRTVCRLFLPMISSSDHADRRDAR